MQKFAANRGHPGVKIMSSPSVKEEIRRLAERLPDDVTWEEIHYQIYVRQAVEAGLKDSREGRTVPIDEARRAVRARTEMIVRWTEAALADHRAVKAYIGRHSPQFAGIIVAKIFDRSDVLAEFPLLGPVVAEFGDESLREIFEDPYRIIDRVVEQQIDVVAIVHSARRLPRGL